MTGSYSEHLLLILFILLISMHFCLFVSFFLAFVDVAALVPRNFSRSVFVGRKILFFSFQLPATTTPYLYRSLAADAKNIYYAYELDL